MAYNNFSYTVFATSDTNRAGLGFTGGSTSTDGTLVVGDMGSTEPCEGCDDNLTKPSWVVAPNWPHMTHQETLTMIQTKATSDGASDGWFWDEAL